jgi:hypothetical protein
MGKIVKTIGLKQKIHIILTLCLLIATIGLLIVVIHRRLLAICFTFGYNGFVFRFSQKGRAYVYKKAYRTDNIENCQEKGCGCIDWSKAGWQNNYAKGGLQGRKLYFIEQSQY